MEYEKIENIMSDMKKYNLTSVDIELPDGTKIRMKKDIEKIVTKEESVKSEVIVEKEAPALIGKVIKSPMVGTFYSKPSPTAESYVSVGKNIKKGDILCIVEAMKLMNEIESEFDGIVKEVLVKDGDSVEYGTELFIIE